MGEGAVECIFVHAEREEEPRMLINALYPPSDSDVHNEYDNKTSREIRKLTGSTHFLWNKKAASRTEDDSSESGGDEEEEEGSDEEMVGEDDEGEGDRLIRASCFLYENDGGERFWEAPPVSLDS